MNIIFAIAIILMIIMAIFLLNGKGAFLIAGYNTASKEKKAKYDVKALCRFTGWVLIMISFCMLCFPVGYYFEMQWLIYCGVAIMVLGTIAASVYANTGNRFHKDVDSEVSSVDENKNTKRSTPKAIIFSTTVIPLIVLIGIGVMIYYGDKDPVVNVLDDSVQIEGMYGLDIKFTDITDITLIEKSMDEIGVGSRTNGYGGIGEALKGNFKSGELGKTLLFVQSKSAPTIRIQRTNGKDVYISFLGRKNTEALYREMIAAMP